MAEYKDTLNLPNTSFPMKASLATREPEMLADWQEKGYMKKFVRLVLAVKNLFCMMALPMRMVIFIVDMR